MQGLEDHRILAPRPDLGARSLVSEWRALAAREGLRREALDGLMIASTLLPLSIWIAVISGAPPETGIASAAIATAFCVFFGGTRVAISGPGMTTALLVASVASQHGMSAVGAVVVGAGALQLIMGALGLGRFARLIPISVVRGAVIGIGALMLLLHLPSVVGLSLEASTPVLQRFDRVGAHLPRASLAALAIAGASALIAVAGALAPRRVPGALLGALLPSIAAAALALDVPRLSTGELPALGWPAMPSANFVQLAFTALALWLTATIGTLTSTMALEERSGQSTDPDQELIGQGLAGVACGLAGCLPPTQLVARSAVALRYEVRSRRPALVHALVVLVAGAAVWPLLAHVPESALTGAVVVTAFPLLDPRPLRDILRVTRFELVVGLVTAAGVALFGIAQGVQSGLALAVIAATFRLARTRALLHASHDADSPHQVSFSGPITFFATLELRRLRNELAALDARAGLVIDLRSVVAIDATGAAELLEVVRAQQAADGRVALLGASPAVRTKLLAACRPDELAGRIATSARDVEPILEKSAGRLGRPHVLAGVARFREEMRAHYDSLFDQLADGQEPHTMFITCADSRISPSLLMGAHPGDLFIVRCIGALVPGADHEHMPQEGAALEYGVGVLGVRHVIVCGHSECGAIKALKKGDVPPELATLTRWGQHASTVAGELASFEDVNAAVRGVTVRQLEHLKSYPLVRERLESGALQLHAWFYDLEAVELFEYDEGEAEFKVLGRMSAPRL